MKGKNGTVFEPIQLEGFPHTSSILIYEKYGNLHFLAVYETYFHTVAKESGFSFFSL